HGQLEPELPRCLAQLGTLLGHEVELRLATAREPREREQVDAFVREPGHHLRALAGAVWKHHVVVVDLAERVGHRFLLLELTRRVFCDGMTKIRTPRPQFGMTLCAPLPYAFSPPS